MKHHATMKGFAAAALTFTSIILHGQTTPVSAISGVTNNYIPVFNNVSTNPATIKNSQIFNDPTYNSNFGYMSIGDVITTPLSGEYFNIRKNVNSYLLTRLINPNYGTAASAIHNLIAASNNSGGTFGLSMGVYSNAYAYNQISYPMYAPGSAILASNGSAGLNVGTTNAAQLSLWTNNASRLAITSGGNVGIGTISPATPLEVTQTGGSSFRIYANTPGDVISTTSMRPHFGTGTDFSIYEGATITGSEPLRFKIEGTTGNITLAPNGTNSGGAKVFIGQKKPVSGQHDNSVLSVFGDISTTAIYVTDPGTKWADFVFDKDYKLMSLPDLEKFYQANHHLPSVPSAKEVSEQGLDLAETDATLLQKIEELTLYVVQQQKEINALKLELEKRK